ncbi:unnamed protein product [Ceutorhynchus assimilis]|uniref:Uncharacterized protein n=1 Tax=Ceutorhynchus assimilis TaxID=467358 RepID=A0A9N9MIV5_9CUCU|nr:unnamed protein product [Ceutorhynchus assimilis]
MSNGRHICVCGREHGKGPVIITISTCKHKDSANGGTSVHVSAPPKATDTKSITSSITSDDRQKSSIRSGAAGASSSSRKSVAIGTEGEKESSKEDKETAWFPNDGGEIDKAEGDVSIDSVYLQKKYKETRYIDEDAVNTTTPEIERSKEDIKTETASNEDEASNGTPSAPSSAVETSSTSRKSVDSETEVEKESPKEDKETSWLPQGGGQIDKEDEDALGRSTPENERSKEDVKTVESTPTPSKEDEASIYVPALEEPLDETQRSGMPPVPLDAVETSSSSRKSVASETESEKESPKEDKETSWLPQGGGEIDKEEEDAVKPSSLEHQESKEDVKTVEPAPTSSKEDEASIYVPALEEPLDETQRPEMPPVPLDAVETSSSSRKSVASETESEKESPKEDKETSWLPQGGGEIDKEEEDAVKPSSLEHQESKEDVKTVEPAPTSLNDDEASIYVPALEEPLDETQKYRTRLVSWGAVDTSSSSRNSVASGTKGEEETPKDDNGGGKINKEDGDAVETSIAEKERSKEDVKTVEPTQTSSNEDEASIYVPALEKPVDETQKYRSRSVSWDAVDSSSSSRNSVASGTKGEEETPKDDNDGGEIDKEDEDAVETSTPEKKRSKEDVKTVKPTQTSSNEDEASIYVSALEEPVDETQKYRTRSVSWGAVETSLSSRNSVASGRTGQEEIPKDDNGEGEIDKEDEDAVETSRPEKERSKEDVKTVEPTQTSSNEDEPSIYVSAVEEPVDETQKHRTRSVSWDAVETSSSSRKSAASGTKDEEETPKNDNGGGKIDKSEEDENAVETSRPEKERSKEDVKTVEPTQTSSNEDEPSIYVPEESPKEDEETASLPKGGREIDKGSVSGIQFIYKETHFVEEPVETNTPENNRSKEDDVIPVESTPSPSNEDETSIYMPAREEPLDETQKSPPESVADVQESQNKQPEDTTDEPTEEADENSNNVNIMMLTETAVNTMPFLEKLFRFRQGHGSKSMPSFDEEQKDENSDCTMEIFMFEKHVKDCRRIKMLKTLDENSFHDGDSWVGSIGRFSFPTCRDEFHSNESSRTTLESDESHNNGSDSEKRH